MYSPNDTKQYIKERHQKDFQRSKVVAISPGESSQTNHKANPLATKNNRTTGRIITTQREQLQAKLAISLPDTPLRG